jgi:ADP-ribosylglycohydrolase
VILGTAVADAVGLPYEGLSRKRVRRLQGEAELGHRFLLGRGMISDDTEHTCMSAQALLAAPEDPARFARSLAWHLRAWLLCLPAGVGFATLRACLKLLVGFGPARSGVYSAGNGPAMRAALLGAFFHDDPGRLDGYVRATSRLTHTDPRAEAAALVIARAAAEGARRRPGDVEGVLQVVTAACDEPELAALLTRVAEHLGDGSDADGFAEALGLAHGVSGYAYHTVPVAMFCWLRYGHDFRECVTRVIRLGGDTDTTAAIVGALAGANLGSGQIPLEWLEGLVEWPRSRRWMTKLADALADGGDSPAWCWPALPFRNLLFLVTVLVHGFRRTLPPY